MSENSDKNLPIEAPDDPRNEKPLVEHLIELRNRMVKAILAIVIVFLVLSPFMKQLFDALSHPLMVALPAGTKLLSTGVVAPFLVPLKVTLFVSFLIALPVVLYQAWAYVAPALYRQEKKLVLPVLVSSVAMFFVGVMYCYFVVFRFVFRFIAQFSPESVNFAPDIDSYFSFVITMFFAFGLTFEVPIVVMVLNHRVARGAEEGPPLHHRGRVRDRGYFHAAGCALADAARSAARDPLSGRHLARAALRQEEPETLHGS